MFTGVPWTVVLALGATGIGMALLSSLVGMRQRIENPAWWTLYVVWTAIVLVFDLPAPFRTILFASVLAGLFHGTTQSLLIDHYIRNNPWYAEQLREPKQKLVRQFILMGLAAGIGVGAVVAGIAWGLRRLLA